MKAIGQRAREMATRMADPSAAWFEGKTFTEDYVSAHLGAWRRLLGEHPGPIRSVLEIGSHQGRSAVFWLRAIPDARITCVDPFPWRKHETLFDLNLAEFVDRVAKVKSTSARALAGFAEEGRVFDFIYVDGNHMRDNVMVDLLLGWQVLAVGGLLLVDDYTLAAGDAHHRPMDAVNTFIDWHNGQADVVLKGYQVALRRVL